ncbi:toll-like receptor 13 isoform X2 [Xiphophorus hellerii]|uniref:toll-like receptor 13 isoform X2 n=1 Tax=Xiphophorus hellerii TaxID=8084 RepID=UPI0013B3D0BE|nr:toll-like receptor 13 isoform X2 [Xiphophorus hellerii]
MTAAGSFHSHLILYLLFLLLYINPLLAFLLKSCTILYQKIPCDDVFLDCASRELVVIPNDIPKDSAVVKLNSNQLKKINIDDFCNLSKLKILDLGDNQISDVDDGSFKDLVTLKTLKLTQNTLTTLTNNIFQGLSNLTVLDLSNNNINFIQPFAFQDLTNLQNLDLGRNKIQQVSDIQQIFQLPQIQMVNLTHNLFSSFETKHLLHNFTSNLEELIISSPNMKSFSISTPIFPNLTKLDLAVSRNCTFLNWDIPDKTLLRNITHLYTSQPCLSFKGFQKVLRSLDSLNHLRLNNMDRFIKKELLSTVCTIPTLRKLDLFYNYLNNLTLKLALCSQLTALDLGETHIKELSKGSIKSMTILQTLSVRANQLSEVPYDIRNLPTLKILNIELNQITKLSCDNFVNTTHLTELYLQNNYITKLKRCVFGNLTNLKILNLSKNNLRKLENVFKLTLHRLEVLNISDNKVTDLETGVFQGLQSIKHLNVASRSIERVKLATFKGINNVQALTVSLTHRYEPDFRGLKRLENLTIYLERVPLLRTDELMNYGAFSKTVLKSLKSIAVICTHNHQDFPLNVPISLLQSMKHLEDFTAENVYVNAPFADIFQFNPQLKSVTFLKTDLSNLDPNLFQKIPNLQALDLSNCKIKALDFMVQANLSALRYLKLAENEISVINETVFHSLPFLTYLDLSKNPFTCDCSNAGFILWAKNQKQTQVANTHQYICFFPADKRGSLLFDYDTLSCWDDSSFFCFVSSSCLVVLTLITSFVYNFLRWQLGYTFHLFRAFLYDSRKRKEGDDYQFDAFVSYNVHDEGWVYREMLPMLEEKQGWKLCLHHRDFQPGKPIIENITDAIYGSRKTICVISRSYLQSEWCSREIQMASFRLFDEKKDVLILLFLEEIPAHHLSPFYRMRKLVKKRTYLSWPQAAQHPGVFWQNVQRALQAGGAVAEPVLAGH